MYIVKCHHQAQIIHTHSLGAVSLLILSNQHSLILIEFPLSCPMPLHFHSRHIDQPWAAHYLSITAATAADHRPFQEINAVATASCFDALLVPWFHWRIAHLRQSFLGLLAPPPRLRCHEHMHGISSGIFHATI